jgi:hypothetical protein
MASCTACPAGTYQPNIMAGSCITCPAGSYCPQGATSPIACGGNTFSAAGAAACRTCPSYTKGPIPGGNGLFNSGGSAIYCKWTGTACVLDSSQSYGGCQIVTNGNQLTACANDSNLQLLANFFCANGGI